MADEPLFTVTPVQSVLDQMKTWGRLAGRLGIGEWFVRAMEEMEKKLHDEPRTWGDPLFDFRHARLWMLQANHENFVVNYGVHMDQPIVFVQRIELLAGSPLFGK